MTYKYHETDLYELALEPIEVDSVLDIGGGGEGFIGKMYGSKAIVIDKRRDELEETENEAFKIVMDATKLEFVNTTFDLITMFYSLLYMPKDVQKQVIQESKKVLAPNGVLMIWDNEVKPVEGKDIHVTHLKVTLGSETIQTGYGVSLREHTCEDIMSILNDEGFETDVEQDGIHFKITAYLK